MKKLIITIGLATSFLIANSPKLVDASDLCYKSRTYPIEYNLLFNSMKKRFLDSNMHLKHVSKKDGYIEAEGVKSYDDKLYRFTFTVNFNNLGDVNRISTLVSYELLKKESQIHSVTQFNLPIPLPWDKAFKYEGYTNVIDPAFFDSFYLNFDKTLFDSEMRSMHVKVKQTENKQLLKDLGEEKITHIKKIKEVNLINKIKEINMTKKVISKLITKSKDLNKSIKLNNKIKNVKESNTTIIKPKGK